MSDVDWHRLPALSTLRAFEATARLQGYSAAARALNVTPAAVAQQVRKLEAEVGASLVQREGRGLVLTEAGRQLAQPLREAFGLIAEGIDTVRRREAARGVRVSTTHFFVDAVILPKLADFWVRHPGVQVTFAPEGNLAPLDFDAFDICVRGRHDKGGWPGHDARPLVRTPVIVCAAPGLIEGAAGDISGLPWLTESGADAATMQGFMRQAGVDPDRARIVNPGEARVEIEAALMGYGLSITTELVIRRYLDDGRLVRVDTPLDVTVTYAALTRKGPLAAPVRHFLDWLTEVCKTTGLSTGTPG